jgi:hypothetical protein
MLIGLVLTDSLRFIPSSALSSFLALVCCRVRNTASATHSFERCDTLAQAVDCIPSSNPELRRQVKGPPVTAGTVFLGAALPYDVGYRRLSNSHFRE